MALVADPHYGSVPIIEPAAEISVSQSGSKGGGDAGARPPNARAGTAVAAVRPETTSGGTIARRCISARPPKWTGGLNRERDAVKRSSGADQVRPSA